MNLRKFEDSNEQDVDALLGSLKMGIKNKWLIAKNGLLNSGRLSFALKYSVIEPGKFYPMHPSEYTEATFIVEGSGIIGNDEEEFEIKAGDLILTHRGEMHSIKNSGQSDLKTLSCIDLMSHE